MLAAFRPRTFWPSFLWTNKDFIKFTYEEIKEQKNVQLAFDIKESYPLISIIKDRLREIGISEQSTKHSCEAFFDSNLALSSLPSLHLKMLSLSLCLFSLPTLNTFLTKNYLIKLIEQHTSNILYDDFLLFRELQQQSQSQQQQQQGYFPNLTNMELIQACLKRGLLDDQQINLTDIIEEEVEKEKEKKKKEGEENETDEILEIANSKELDNDIKEEQILERGKWNRKQLESRLYQWILLMHQIKQLKVPNMSSIISHLIALGYRPTTITKHSSYNSSDRRVGSEKNR